MTITPFCFIGCIRYARQPNGDWRLVAGFGPDDE
jgi:hypothetical protein